MPYVSSPAAAKIIGVDESTIRRYVYRGVLTARRVGLRKNIRIDVDELRDLAEKLDYRFNEDVAEENIKED